MIDNLKVDRWKATGVIQLVPGDWLVCDNYRGK